MNEEQEIKELIQELSKKGVWARKSTKERLAEIGEPAVPYLVEKVKDENSWVVYDVITDIGEPAVPYLIEALKATDNIPLKGDCGNLIGRIGVCAVPYLEDALKDGENRRYIVEIMGSINDSSVITILTKALDDEEDTVRCSAARSLGEIAQKGHDVSKAVPKLIKMLKGMGSLSAMGATHALGDIKDPRAFPHLIERLKSETSSYEAVKALKKIGKPAVPCLLEALKHENGMTKERIIDLLGEIRDESSVPALIGILKEYKNEELLKAAMKTISKIGHASANPVLMDIFRNNERLEDKAFEALRINAINLFHKKEYAESLRTIKEVMLITRNKYGPWKNSASSRMIRSRMESFSDLIHRIQERMNRLDRDEPLKIKRKAKPRKGKSKKKIKH